MYMSSVRAVTTDTFQSEVLDFKGIVLVDFYADWCGPCKFLAPHIDTLAEEMAENTQVKFVKLNVDNAPEIAEKYGVQGIPNIILYQNGQVAANIVGVPQGGDPKELYRNAIQQILGGTASDGEASSQAA